MSVPTIHAPISSGPDRCFTGTHSHEKLMASQKFPTKDLTMRRSKLNKINIPFICDGGLKSACGLVIGGGGVCGDLGVGGVA